MHKSIIILSVMFFAFDLSAGKKGGDSNLRALDIYGIDDCSYRHKKNRKSFDWSTDAEDVAGMALLKKCKAQNQKLKHLEAENEALRSKLAKSPEESAKSDSESSNPDKLSLDGRSSSSGTSPMTIKVLLQNSSSETSSPITIVRLSSKGKESVATSSGESAAIPVCESPCGFKVCSSPGMPSSFPGNSNLLRYKNVSPFIPYYSSDCP